MEAADALDLITMLPLIATQRRTTSAKPSDRILRGWVGAAT